MTSNLKLLPNEVVDATLCGCRRFFFSRAMFSRLLSLHAL